MSEQQNGEESPASGAREHLANAGDSLPSCGEIREAYLSAAPAKTLIVGCNGRMGQMLAKKGAAAGLNVSGTDMPFTDEALASACAGIDAALLCVPAAHLEETLVKIIPWLRPDAILADITSVKEAPMRIMEKYWPGPVVGTHPLFGPQTSGDADKPVTIVPGQNARPEHVRKIASFFQCLDCRVFESTAQKHDQAMAKIQNMNFITNLAYFALVAEDRDLLPFLTPSFERRKTAAAKMLTEDSEMFTGLFEANEHSQEAVRQYRSMLTVAASGDIELLCKRAQWWWKQAEKTAPDKPVAACCSVKRQ